MLCAANNINVLQIQHFRGWFSSLFVNYSIKFNQKYTNVRSTGCKSLDRIFRWLNLVM